MRKNLKLLFIVLLLLIIGCAKPIDPEISKTIKTYNEILVESLYTERLLPLREIATSYQINTVVKSINKWQKENKKMQSKLISMEVTSQNIEGLNATAETYEKWQFRFVNRKNNKPITGWESVEYIVSYRLINVADTWKISNVTINKQI